jgi:hypothetical protein
MSKVNYTLISEYQGSDKFKSRTAEVLQTVGHEPHNYYGIRMLSEGESLAIEWYPAHNVIYAENAAENFVMGIKNYERPLNFNYELDQ